MHVSLDWGGLSLGLELGVGQGVGSGMSAGICFLACLPFVRVRAWACTGSRAHAGLWARECRMMICRRVT